MSALTDAMNLVLFVGAARNDATAAQLVRLRTEVIVLMQADAYLESGDETAIRATVAEIMGSEWAPGPEWQLQP